MKSVVSIVDTRCTLLVIACTVSHCARTWIWTPLNEADMPPCCRKQHDFPSRHAVEGVRALLTAPRALSGGTTNVQQSPRNDGHRELMSLHCGARTEDGPQEHQSYRTTVEL